MSQSQMATALGLLPNSYAKLEQNGRMALHLVPRFAAIVGVDCDMLLTGRRARGPGANEPDQPGGDVVKMPRSRRAG